MYICSFCSKSCKTLGGLHKHEHHCLNNPNHAKQPNFRNEPNPQLCSYCNKICKNLNSKALHEKYCKLNPNKVLNPSASINLSNRSWGKGKTKGTDSRLALRAINLHNKYISGELVGHQKGRLRTTEEKNKISATLRSNPLAGGRRIGSGRGKKGWYKGFFCDSTYELVYIIYNLDNNIPFSRCNRVYNYYADGKLHKYYPDFELADGTIIELKGYHTSLVDLKTASVTDRPIRVLYEKDLSYAFDWVRNNYTYTNITDLYE